MREIKFRARVKIPANFYRKGEDERIETICFTLEDLLSDRTPTIIKHSMTELLSVDRWSGLLDKNGKEIYEGDIVKNKWDLICEIDWNETVSQFQLFGEEGIRGLEWSWALTTSRIKKEGIEVIGNIYENPNLLTPKQIREAK